MKLSSYSIKRKIQTLLKSNSNRKFKSLELDKTDNILILSDYEDILPLQEIIKSEPLLKNKVTVCYINGAKETELLLAKSLKIDLDKDTNAFLIPSMQCIESFNSINADMIIDLSNSSSYTLKYLMLQHPALFKVGIKQSKDNLYDLSILMTESNDLRQNFDQILFYLKRIRSK